jgi:hypothetical protein
LTLVGGKICKRIDCEGLILSVEGCLFSSRSIAAYRLFKTLTGGGFSHQAFPQKNALQV